MGGAVGGFGSRAAAQLCQYVADVHVDGAGAQEQVAGDFVVGAAGGYEADHFQLTAGEASGVELVGCGAPEAALYWPGLTTVRQPSHAMGDAACKALLKMIESPGVVDTTRLDLPAQMITRESTGPAPRAPSARRFRRA